MLFFFSFYFRRLITCMINDSPLVLSKRPLYCQLKSANYKKFLFLSNVTQVTTVQQNSALWGIESKHARTSEICFGVLPRLLRLNFIFLLLSCVHRSRTRPANKGTKLVKYVLLCSIYLYTYLCFRPEEVLKPNLETTVMSRQLWFVQQL